jgi:hypothetical protein
METNIWGSISKRTFPHKKETIADKLINHVSHINRYTSLCQESHDFLWHQNCCSEIFDAVIDLHSSQYSGKILNCLIFFFRNSNNETNNIPLLVLEQRLQEESSRNNLKSSSRVPLLPNKRLVKHEILTMLLNT